AERGPLPLVAGKITLRIGVEIRAAARMRKAPRSISVPADRTTACRVPSPDQEIPASAVLPGPFGVEADFAQESRTAPGPRIGEPRSSPGPETFRVPEQELRSAVTREVEL